MTRDETLKILAVLDTAYRGRFSSGNPEITVAIWEECLKKYSYDNVYRAIMRFIKFDKTGYAPLPAQIREIAVKIKKQRDVIETENKFSKSYGGGMNTDEYDYEEDESINWIKENM